MCVARSPPSVGPMSSAAPRVAILGPNPLLTITVEARGDGRDELHMHAGGQGVWVARMAAELGAAPVLCGFAGGESGVVLAALLGRLGIDMQLVEVASDSGSYVVDRRGGAREVVAYVPATPPTRHEIDDLVSITCSEALAAEVLVLCNPYPADTLPVEVYANLVADCEGNGTPVLVDLSTPRLDAALTGAPTLVKLNDWELAEYVCGPVSEPGELSAAAARLLDAGARAVLVTTGAGPVTLFAEGSAWRLDPPSLSRGSREGCGDSMMGALAASLARGTSLRDAVTAGAAAGTANFLRHGLGTGSLPVVERIASGLELRPYQPA